MTKLRRLFGWLWHHKLITLASLFALGLISATGGTAIGLSLEEHDEFCASCHTQPEYDFWMRSRMAASHPAEISDLATFHMVPESDNKNPKREPVKCIGCHGGATLLDRIETATTLGALDTIKFIAFDIKQPAKLSAPLPNSYCAQCHASEVVKPGFDNHFHNKLDDPKAPPLNCVGCHAAHAEADKLNTYVLREVAYPTCNTCHKQLGGPTNLR
jgi:nitrate/TMAO reductase-like tetraheme cytochrome c subunit